ncbi:hypothetical protein RRG08_046836 [Elysia crispata]|uniref:Uncharacterized protein n=1 Tax=Elysia crispata TaxID=231223 RepID=A0AAE0ZNT9_9GAST|nr:hypothetical protein RRG08_046836 [Elysia crispata]
MYLLYPLESLHSLNRFLLQTIVSLSLYLSLNQLPPYTAAISPDLSSFQAWAPVHNNESTSFTLYRMLDLDSLRHAHVSIQPVRPVSGSLEMRKSILQAAVLSTLHCPIGMLLSRGIEQLCSIQLQN